MSTYPLMPVPFWGEVLDTLLKRGVRALPQGQDLILEHDVNGITYRAFVQNLPATTPVEFDVVRSICRRLRIGPEIFGLHLG